MIVPTRLHRPRTTPRYDFSRLVGGRNRLSIETSAVGVFFNRSRLATPCVNRTNCGRNSHCLTVDDLEKNYRRSWRHVPPVLRLFRLERLTARLNFRRSITITRGIDSRSGRRN